MKEIIFAFLLAGESVQLGVVKEVKGKAQILRAGVGPVEPALKGSVLFNGDVVRTEKESELIVGFKDGSFLTVYESSEVKIEEKELAPQSKFSRIFTLIKIAIGRMRVFVQKISEERGVTAFTPSSVMGVRGTDFTIACAVDGSTVLEVEDGEVEFNAGEMKVEKGKRLIFDVEKGFTIQSKAIPFNYDEWARKKLEDFTKRQKEILNAINSVMEQRFKRFQGIVEGASVEEEEKVEESLEGGFVLKEMFDFSESYYAKKGLSIEERMKEVRERFRRLEEKVEKRYQRKKERIERKLREKERKIDERFKEMEEKMK